MSRRPAPVFAWAAISLVLAACGSARPGAEALAAGMTTGTSWFPIAEQYAVCAAEHLLASDLDDELLHAIADSDTAYEPDAQESSRLASLQVEVLTMCPSEPRPQNGRQGVLQPHSSPHD